jgi:hypothetical protein
MPFVIDNKIPLGNLSKKTKRKRYKAKALIGDTIKFKTNWIEVIDENGNKTFIPPPEPYYELTFFIK